MDKNGKVVTMGVLTVVLLALAFVVYAAPKKCNNNIDDDNDGLIDWPNDPGCSSRTDNTETSPSLVCDNGADETDDADALADFRLTNGDPGCTSATDPSEIDGQCDDLSDNDGDTHVDFGFPNDSKCETFSDNDESPRDFCNDSDGGINVVTQGTVSGDDNSIPFSNTDFCLTNTTVREYYCGGYNNDYNPLTTDFNCAALNTTMVNCVNGACV